MSFSYFLNFQKKTIYDNLSVQQIRQFCNGFSNFHKYFLSFSFLSLSTLNRS